MGCGKTTLGREIAQKHDMDFVDMDEQIQEQEGKSIGEIFAEYGEDHFRNLESKLLSSFSKNSNLVISTGGGAPCFNHNMEVINSLGTSVYIKLDADTLSGRLRAEKESRPLISSLSEEELLDFIEIKLAERAFFYEQAHQVFTTIPHVFSDS